MMGEPPLPHEMSQYLACICLCPAMTSNIHRAAMRKWNRMHKHACAFDSIYAWRLYECLKSWQDTGKYTPDIETFHEAMEAPPSCRQNFKALRIRVIEPAVSAIIEKSDLLVQWKPVKAGRKVIG